MSMCMSGAGHVPSSAAGGLQENVGEDGLGLQRRLEDLQTLQNLEEMQRDG